MVEHLVAQGTRLREGWDAQARAHGFPIRQTGPVQMPLVMFDDDEQLEKVALWASESVQRGVYVHPWHNMFLCAANRPEDIDQALERTDDAFAAVEKTFSG